MYYTVLIFTVLYCTLYSLGYEDVSAGHEDVLLAEDVLLLLGLHDVLLLQTLEGVGHAGLLPALDQLHPPKPANTQGRHHLHNRVFRTSLLLGVFP